MSVSRIKSQERPYAFSKSILITDDVFSTGIGLERIGIAGAGPLALGVGILCKNKRQKRIDGGSPVAAPMPKSVFSKEREDQLLRE